MVVTLTADRSVLLLVDLQQRLMPAIAGGEAVVANVRRLAEAARLLGVPVVATEQNPAGLGGTIPALAPLPTRRLEKRFFDATREEDFESFLPAGRPAIVAAGCEAHVRHADGARASRPRPRRQPRRRRRRLAKHREPRRGARPRGAPRRRARDHRDGAVRVARDERSPAISRGAGIGEGIERAAAAMTSTTPSDAALRRTVAAVALLNLAYFGVEFSVALAIGSVSLFADSVDFLEDASINLLILMALGWSAGTRARVGMALAAILLVPGLATLWTAWQKFSVPVPPAPLPLSLAGAGALAVNLACALLLARFRRHAGSLTRAAFLSARNDAFANVAIVAAGLVTAATLSAWPDLIVGLAIAAMNAGAAREVFAEARREHAAAAEP